VGNRPEHPDNVRAAAQCDSEINSPKKMPRRRKYEGKRFESSRSVCLPRRSRAPAINRSGRELSQLFILVAGNFSNMFTTYSHVLYGCPRQGLRLEISCESDKKKMNFIFDYDQKIFLTGKMKHACHRENKKQCVENFCDAAATDSESPQRTDFAADRLRIPS
jgi:hypothetical protein